MIKRQLTTVISKHLFKGKAIVLIGARQVGKSTLFEMLTADSKVQVAKFNCDIQHVRDTFENVSVKDLLLIIGGAKIVLIDEAQRVRNIGMTLKLITDNFPDVQLLVTGSSSLELLSDINEPLTGRKLEYRLFPISTAELIESYGYMQAKEMLEPRLIYGSYPDIVNNPDMARELIVNLSGSYLYKDVLEMESVRRPVLLDKLLVALALQIGSEVSYSELAQTVGSDPKTVEKYVDLLEKCHIIFRLYAFSRNLRNELKKSRKVFFYDNGIRNAVLQNFARPSLRDDMGALWENFFISERIKRNEYTRHYAKIYFWRSTQQQEIDFVEESDGEFTTFEMKWNPKKSNAKLPKIFEETYPVKSFNVVTPENYIEFLG